MISRATDLMFASQSRHALADIHRRFCSGGHPDLSIIHVVYRQQEDEIGLKAFDYSRHSIQSRWECGYSDGLGVIHALQNMPPRRTCGDVWIFRKGASFLRAMI
jgi:NTE family protein